MTDAPQYRNQQPEPWENAVVLLGVVLVCVLLLVGASSCSPRIVENWRTITQTTSYREIEYLQNVQVPIPLEKDQAIVHVGDTSHRETSVARSDAWIGDDGLLHHTLENKSDKSLPAVVPVKAVEMYNGVTDKNAQYLTKIVEKEKPLTRWKSFKIGSFWYLCAGIVALLLWTFRKTLKKLIL